MARNPPPQWAVVLAGNRSPSPTAPIDQGGEDRPLHTPPTLGDIELYPYVEASNFMGPATKTQPLPWLKPLSLGVSLAVVLGVYASSALRGHGAQPSASPIATAAFPSPPSSPPKLSLFPSPPSPSRLSVVKADIGGGEWLVILILVLGGTVIGTPFIGLAFGLVVVGDRQVGIVIKKFARRSLPPGQLIALQQEAGLQADTLAPGWHWGLYFWQYSVRLEPVIVIPQGEIGLVIANDGATIPPSRILGKTVPCNDYQDARRFLTQGGEKGRQLGIITAGTYRINTGLFTVITSATATKHDMKPEQLRLSIVQANTVGIVTTLDGKPIEAGEIAGPIIPHHDNFQNGQKFMDGGGYRGLQEQVILSGSWNLNPWLLNIEQVPLTEIPIGYVGVVISYVGRSTADVTGDAFTHGNLVKQGDKGVWIDPLYPGTHPLNTRIMKVELVPTTNIVLNFSSRIQSEHGYDSKLRALKLLSFDGFDFDLEVFQIIHVGALDAPKVISRLGSMQNLVDHVLRPIVGNYFRNSAQEYTILDFLIARSERQAEAADYVRSALRAYDVQAVDSLIGLITPPPALMETLTDRKIAEEQEKTYQVQRLAQSQRQELVRETALANIQQEVVTAEQGVRIAELQASARVNQASGEAEATRLQASGEAAAIRLTGQAKADAYRLGVEALGGQEYTLVQLMQIVGDRNVRVVPDVAVNSASNSTGLLDGLMGMMLWNQAPPKIHAALSHGSQEQPSPEGKGE